MRFIVDECTGPHAAEWLQQPGYEVYSVFDETPGSTDDQILDKACTENSVLITNDKDFGELVYRDEYQRGHPLQLRFSRLAAKSKVWGNPL